MPVYSLAVELQASRMLLLHNWPGRSKFSVNWSRMRDQ